MYTGHNQIWRLMCKSRKSVTFVKKNPRRSVGGFVKKCLALTISIIVTIFFPAIICRYERARVFVCMKTRLIYPAVNLRNDRGAVPR